MRRWSVLVLLFVVACGDAEPLIPMPGGTGDMMDPVSETMPDMTMDMMAAPEMSDPPVVMEPDPGTPDMPEEMLEGVGTACTVAGESGVCLEVSSCATPGVATPGFCPGPAEVQCCVVPEPPEDPPKEDPMTPGNPSSGCGQALRSGTMTVQHGGRARTFEVHVPSGYDANAPTPVVLNFHGRNSSAGQQVFLSNMTDQADRSGFIAVHPSGVGNTWNAGLCCGTASSSDIDDVGFVSAMLDELERTACVDTKRVYATGLSNGGFIAHRLGCELSDRIAAIAPVAGTLLTSCSPSNPVPVLHIHGTSDFVVRYDGFAGFVSVADTIDTWVDKNGCNANPTPDPQLRPRGIDCEIWSGCRGGAEVRLCSLDGVGHQWPGGPSIPGLGSNTDDYDATAEMWRFFEQHTR